MKYAIISDIHANLEALTAVLADAAGQRCTHHAFLGDFVGYCADPKACLDIVRAMNAPCIKGNHDEYCAANLPLTDFSARAAKGVQWTRKQLSDDERRWLGGLPYVLKVENFTIVHATLSAPERWHYVFDTIAAAASFPFQNTSLCFFGHTHVPLAFIRDTNVRGGTFSKFKIEPGKQFFINAGSVGQPRDQIPKAAYVTYDMDDQRIELRRVEFDAAETQRKMRDAGLGL